MKKKTVIFVSDVDYFKGGAERSIFDVMATPGLSPILAVPNEGPLSQHAQNLDIPCIEIPYGAVKNIHRPFHLPMIFSCFISAIKAGLALKKAAKKRGAIALHSNGLKAHSVACLARLFGAPPVTLHYRAIPYTFAEKLFWRASQIIAKHVVIVSRPCWPWDRLPNNVQIIFNGIKMIDPKILPKRTSRKPFMLGFVGRIHPSKGLHDLIIWFDYAYKKGLDIRLSIRGAAAVSDKDYEARIKAMITERKLDALITFSGQKSDYKDIYAGMDVNIVPSVTPDPLPRSIMEASVLGIPVLGYPAGGIPDMIDNGVNGFLFENGQELYEILKNLSRDKASYNCISDAAIDNVKHRFSMPALHESIKKLYT